MKVVLRKYSGAGSKELFDVLAKHSADVDKLLRSVKGFVSYTLGRTAGGGITVTVCQDQNGIDESTQKAKDWIAQNAAKSGAGAPEVTVGDVVIHLT